MGSPNFFALGLNGVLTPPDGAKTTGVIPLSLVAGRQLQIDLRAAQINQNLLSAAQSMYCDNAGNPLPLTFSFSSGQVLVVPDHCQGYFTILQPNPIQFNVECAGNFLASVMLMNFQIPPIFWSAA